MKTRFALALMVVLAITFLSGCGGTADVSGTIVKDDIIVYIAEEGNDTGDLYIIKDDEERKRIASNVIVGSYIYLNNSKSLLYVDSEQVLYYQMDQGERVTITDEVNPYSLMVSEDESAFAYLKGSSSDLYFQQIAEGGITDRIRVAADIETKSYGFSMDGNILIYVDGEENLFIKEGIESPIRIASNVHDAYITKDNQTIVFVNDKRDIYVRNLEDADNRRISANDVFNINISHENKNVAYLADFSRRDFKGELYILEQGTSPLWLASDVKDYVTSDCINKYFFVNDDNTLFFRDIAEDRNMLIASDVSAFIPIFEREEVVYLTNDETLYLGGKDKESRRIAGNVELYTIVSGCLYYLNDDKDLYLYGFDKEPEKISPSVKDFRPSDNYTAIAYYTEEKEVYLVNSERISNLVIKDADRYSRVYICNRLLFERRLGISDLVGIWEDKENPFISIEDRLYFEFTRDNTLLYYSILGKVVFDIKVEGYSETSGFVETIYSDLILADYLEDFADYIEGDELFFDEEMIDNFDVEMIDNNEIIIDGTNLLRINKESLNKALDEFEEKFIYEMKLEEALEEASNLGYDLWYTRLEVPAGTECRSDPGMDGEILGNLIYTDVWYVTDYYVDEDANLWLEIELEDPTEYVWVLYNISAPAPAPAPGAETISFGFVPWACAEASTHIAQAVIMDKLGYDVSVTSMEVAGMYSRIAEGDLDAQTTAWLPVTHADYMEQYGAQLDDYGVMFEGARIGLLVPTYVTINSIEEMDDYAEEFNGRIVGIDAGAGIMRATETALEEYNLNNVELMASSDAAMTAALANACLNDEWVAVTGWSPHWIFADFDLKYLGDPLGIYGGEETINVIARQGLDADAPDVANFLQNMFLTDEQLGAVIGAIADGQEPLAAARQWISENEDVVNSWL